MFGGERDIGEFIGGTKKLIDGIGDVPEENATGGIDRVGRVCSEGGVRGSETGEGCARSGLV